MPIPFNTWPHVLRQGRRGNVPSNWRCRILKQPIAVMTPMATYRFVAAMVTGKAISIAPRAEVDQSIAERLTRAKAFTAAGCGGDESSQETRLRGPLPRLGSAATFNP
ncbi:MAG: hypothetical protein WA688_07495 [Thermoplasmata archaeon]